MFNKTKTRTNLYNSKNHIQNDKNKENKNKNVNYLI